MTCDEAIRAIEAMIDREIDDGERMQLEAHLAECESCRRETEERRAFSDRIGRDLDEAFPSSNPATPRIVFRPRRSAWIRWAAVVLVGFAIGYGGASSGFFKPATAEAREVADLSALKDAYESRDRELSARLVRDAGRLDLAVAGAPESTARDVGALCIMRVATGFAGNEPISLPPETDRRVHYVVQQLSSKDWPSRGRAVYALRALPAGDVGRIESQLGKLKGSDRTFTELWVRSMKSPTDPAVDFTVESGGKQLRFVQLANANVRVEAPGATLPKVYESRNLLEFRAAYPELAEQLRLKGVDGNFTVAGVHQMAPAVESRPTAYVPAVVWSAPGTESGQFMEALSVQAVMSDCARAGRTLEETEQKGLEVMRRVHQVSSSVKTAVHADPAQVRRHLAALRGFDRARLTVTRERLHDDVAVLERRVADMERRIEWVLKALATLEYSSANR